MFPETLLSTLYNLLGYARYTHTISLPANQLIEKINQLDQGKKLSTTINLTTQTFTVKRKRKFISFGHWRGSEFRENAIIEGTLHELSPTQTEIKYLLRPNPGFFGLFIVFAPLGILAAATYLTPYFGHNHWADMFIFCPLILIVGARYATRNLREQFMQLIGLES